MLKGHFEHAEGKEDVLGARHRPSEAVCVQVAELGQPEWHGGGCRDHLEDHDGQPSKAFGVSWSSGIVHLSEIKAGGIFLEGITLPGFSSRTGAVGC